jgi:uncharacterized membrane protein YwzB
MFPAALIQVVVALAIVGLILWVLQQIPMDAVIARIIRVVIIVVVVIWLLTLLLGYAGGVSVPSFHR